DVFGRHGMECPIGGPRCSEGYAKGNPALNCSPKSYTTERPPVPYRSIGRAAPTRSPNGVTGGVSPARRRVARGGQRAAAVVDEGLTIAASHTLPKLCLGTRLT